MYPTKICICTAALLALCATPVLAERGKSVADKSRPDYDAIGIRIGSLTIKPKMSLGLESNDNIYATENNTVSDTITVATPEVEVKSDWSRHALKIVTGVESGLYSSKSDENYLDAKLLLDGRLDVQRESFLTAAAGIQKLHEDRSSPDSSTAWDSPAEYTQSNMDMAYMHGFGRTSITAGTGITSIDYSSVDLVSGGSDSLNERDRILYNVNGRLAYELLPNVKPFLSSRYEWRAYDQSDVQGEPQRDSEGYRIALGTGFDLGGVTTGEIFAGYMQQDYDTLEDVSGPWFGLNLLWNVTQLTSVQAYAQSSVKESTLDNSSGINAIDANIRIDHELLRNLLVGGFFSYTRDDYQSVDITDTYTSLGPRVTYLINRNFNADFSYAYKVKDSNETDREFTENVFLLSITAKL